MKKFNRIAIHIGLPKTGTTYLQHVLFPAIPNVEVVEGWHSHRQLMRTNLKNHIIISDEEISGWLWEGAYFGDFFLNLQKIKKIYLAPKIIFGIRNQLSFILSVYKQYLQEKGYRDFDYLFNTDNTGLLKHEDLLIMPKIRFLKENFNDVFIYSQESLLQKEEYFIAAFTKFLGIETRTESVEPKKNVNGRNEGVKSQLQVKTLQGLNKISHQLENLHPGLSFYSHRFKKFGITPRNICQVHLRNIKSEKFEISKRYKDFIRKHYTDDWYEATKHVSY